MQTAVAVSRVPVTLGRYRIVSTIGRGGMAVVYRAVDTDTGEAVAVKTVAMTRALNLECFRREVHALARMSHPGIVRIREQGVGDGVRWCAMDLVEGTPLRRLFSGGDDAHEDATETGHITGVKRTRRAAAPLRGDALVRVLCILRRLCVPLAFLHGEGIVHRDLKPENVVVTPDGWPVIVDFGLASRFGGAISREDVSAEQHAELGTLGYMAPEQQRGELYDARVDIYAMGCMIYEAITGRVPTDASPASAFAPDVDPRLESLVMQLLAADPRDRLGYADSLAAALTPFAGDEQPPGPPPRTYLYRPTFTGRKGALAELGAWADAQISGVAVVRGESGVGKTRLVMEVARGEARVITAECVPVSGATSGPIQAAPLHPLRPLLRFITDHCRAAGPEVTRRILGKRLRVLAAYEPDLLELATSEHAEPPELSAQGARARLFADLTETLGELTRDAPLLLVIDDLQWADELTLTFLTEQLASLRQTRVRVIATYRSEASSPPLEQLEAAAQLVVDVHRLDDDAVSAIVADMLAMPAPPDALTRFMREHSEGNPFFVAEYLRTAAQVGWLARDGAGRWTVVAENGARREQLPLPHSVRDLVTQRLAGLSDTATGFIDAASVIGRDVEPALLAAMLDLDEPTELETLEELLRRQVFEELPSQTLRFSHDKLREVAYGRLAITERRSLHGRAASALERVRGDDPTTFGVLAHHFLEAALDARAIDWLEKAGEHALRTAGHGQARQFFERALSLDVPDLAPLRLRRWTRKVAEAAFGQGDIEEGERRAVETLGLLTGGLPSSKGGWAWLLFRALARQGLAWTMPKRSAPRPEADRAHDLEAALAAGQLASIYYLTGDALQLVAMLLVGVNLADRAGSPSAVIESLARLGYVAGVGGVHRAANHYFERARTLAGDDSGRALTLYLHAFYHLGLAEWTEAETKGRRALALLVDSGDRQDAEIAQTIVAHAVFFSGRIEAARREYEQVLASARGRGNLQHEAWALFLLARSDLAMGDPGRALPQLESAESILSKSVAGDRYALVMCRGLLAQTHLARGDLAAADRTARAMDEHLAGPVLPLVACFHGYVGAAETYLACGDRESARVASKNLARFARTFPMAKAASLRVSAECDLLEGKTARAVARLRESLASARKHGMPYDEGLANAALDRLAMAT